jgi:hypothetical protein
VVIRAQRRAAELGGEGMDEVAGVCVTPVRTFKTDLVRRLRTDLPIRIATRLLKEIFVSCLRGAGGGNLWVRVQIYNIRKVRWFHSPASVRMVLSQYRITDRAGIKVEIENKCLALIQNASRPQDEST